MRYLRLHGGLRFVGPIFLLIAIALLSGAVAIFQHERTNLPSWPPVEAEVIRSYIITRKHPGDTRTFYTAQHELRFTVHDREYVTVADCDEPSTVYAAVEATVDQFQAGSRRLIHYNPENPADVRVESSAVRPFLAPLLLGGIGSVFLLFGIGWSWGMLQRSCEAAISRARWLILAGRRHPL